MSRMGKERERDQRKKKKSSTPGIGIARHSESRTKRTVYSPTVGTAQQYDFRDGGIYLFYCFLIYKCNRCQRKRQNGDVYYFSRISYYTYIYIYIVNSQYNILYSKYVCMCVCVEKNSVSIVGCGVYCDVEKTKK